MLNVMAGFDGATPPAWSVRREDYTRDLNQPLAGLRVGLPREILPTAWMPTWPR
jgi:aspartyl-tRNA(Asn)/glutamyl-tRNA(Gln) amidotransferase subunit A